MDSSNWVTALATHNEAFAVGHNAGNVAVYKPGYHVNFAAYTEEIDPLLGCTVMPTITSMCFHPFSHWIGHHRYPLLTSNAHLPKLYLIDLEAQTSQLKAEYGGHGRNTQPHTYLIHSVDFSSTGEYALSSDDLVTNVWDSEDSREEICSLKPCDGGEPSELLTRSVFHPTKSNVVYSSTTSGRILAVDLREGKRPSVAFVCGKFSHTGSAEDCVKSFALYGDNAVLSRTFNHLSLWDIRSPRREPCADVNVHNTKELLARIKDWSDDDYLSHICDDAYDVIPYISTRTTQPRVVTGATNGEYVTYDLHTLTPADRFTPPLSSVSPLSDSFNAHPFTIARCAAYNNNMLLCHTNIGNTVRSDLVCTSML